MFPSHNQECKKMEQRTFTEAEVAQLAAARRQMELDRQIKNGAGWFFWIAALSLINSLMYFFGSETTFVVGLGFTQLIDGLAVAIGQQSTPDMRSIILILGYVLDLALIVGFFLFGLFGRKRIRWVIILGMVLYALDGVLVLVFGAWFSALFHLLALWGLWMALKAINEMETLEAAHPNGMPVIPQSVYNPQAAQEEGKSRFSKLGRGVLIALLLIVVLIAALTVINNF